MLVCGNVQPLENFEMVFHRKAMRDAAICVGLWRIGYAIFFAVLYVEVAPNIAIQGEKGPILLTLTGFGFFPNLIVGGVILFGALQYRLNVLQTGLYLIMFVAVYNAIVGIYGALYFIKLGYRQSHYVLATAYVFLVLSIIITLWYDVVVISQYKKSYFCHHGALTPSNNIFNALKDTYSQDCRRTGRKDSFDTNA